MLKQVQSQKLLQKLSPQQIQLMKLLQLPTIALEQRIKEEMEINPALEEGNDTDEEPRDEFDNDEFDDTQKDDENQREDFALTDYMDDDEGTSYKLKANNTSPDEERRNEFEVSNRKLKLINSNLSLFGFFF